MTLKVLISDQHPIVRDGIRTLLEAEDDIEVLDTTDSGLHAMALIRTLRPDVVLTGLSLIGISGLELARRISREDPQGASRVVVIALDGGDEMVAEALHAGVSGLLTRGATREELCAAVRAAADGHTMLAPEITARLVGWFRERRNRPEPVDDGVDLTPRERQVLLLVASGHSTEAIAADLSIGVTTVRTHLHNLRVKLEVKNLSQLVSYAFRAGLVPTPERPADRAQPARAPGRPPAARGRYAQFRRGDGQEPRPLRLGGERQARSRLTPR